MFGHFTAFLLCGPFFRPLLQHSIFIIEGNLENNKKKLFKGTFLCIKDEPFFDASNGSHLGMAKIDQTINQMLFV